MRDGGIFKEVMGGKREKIVRGGGIYTEVKGGTREKIEEVVNKESGHPD